MRQMRKGRRQRGGTGTWRPSVDMECAVGRPSHNMREEAEVRDGAERLVLAALGWLRSLPELRPSGVATTRRHLGVPHTSILPNEPTDLGGEKWGYRFAIQRVMREKFVKKRWVRFLKRTHREAVLEGKRGEFGASGTEIGGRGGPAWTLWTGAATERGGYGGRHPPLYPLQGGEQCGGIYNAVVCLY